MSGSEQHPMVPKDLGDQSKTLEEILKEQAPEVLKSIPGNKRGGLQVAIQSHSLSMRSGPLPDPAELAAYGQIIPHGADRIMKMAEAQSRHRIFIEKITVISQQIQGFCGQLFGLIIALGGLYAALHGQPFFGGTTLVAIVSAFLYSRHSDKEDLSAKRQQMLETDLPQKTKKKNKTRR